MKKVEFLNRYGTGTYEYVLEENIRSIFDGIHGGNIATDGKYYVLHSDHKTHETYVLSKESEEKADALGYPLEENEIAIFNGEKVRGMTFKEECAWNEDRLLAHIDLWGNIAVNEEFDYEWYYENCM